MNNPNVSIKEMYLLIARVITMAVINLNLPARLIRETLRCLNMNSRSIFSHVNAKQGHNLASFRKRRDAIREVP